MTYALLDGKLIHGLIHHGLGSTNMKLAGVPTGEPRRKIKLDKPDPATGWYFRWVTPMRPPTELEVEQWSRNTFLYEGEKVFLDDVQILKTEDVFCAECQQLADGVVNDFLCVGCRYAPSS